MNRHHNNARMEPCGFSWHEWTSSPSISMARTVFENVFLPSFIKSALCFSLIVWPCRASWQTLSASKHVMDWGESLGLTAGEQVSLLLRPALLLKAADRKPAMTRWRCVRHNTGSFKLGGWHSCFTENKDELSTFFSTLFRQPSCQMVPSKATASLYQIHSIVNANSPWHSLCEWLMRWKDKDTSQHGSWIKSRVRARVVEDRSGAGLAGPACN